MANLKRPVLPCTAIRSSLGHISGKQNGVVEK